MLQNLITALEKERKNNIITYNLVGVGKGIKGTEESGQKETSKYSEVKCEVISINFDSAAINKVNSPTPDKRR